MRMRQSRLFRKLLAYGLCASMALTGLYVPAAASASEIVDGGGKDPVEAVTKKIHVSLGAPNYYSADRYRLSDLTISCDDDQKIYMATVTVNNGSVEVQKNPELYTLLTDIHDENHQIFTMTFTSGLNSAQAQTILRQNVTFSPEGEEQNVKIKVDGNRTNLKDADTITSKVDKDGKMHYYSFVSVPAQAGDGSEITWLEAYNAAKTMYFGGMQGYLVTVTSKEEDEILDNLTTQDGWSGGARFARADGNLDADTSDDIVKDEDGRFSLSNVYRWMCGPEAGKIYFYGKTSQYDTSIETDYGDTQANKNDQLLAAGGYTHWQLNEPNNNYRYDDTADGVEYCMEVHYQQNQGWNDYANEGNWQPVQGYFVEFGGYDNEDNDGNLIVDEGKGDETKVDTKNITILPIPNAQQSEYEGKDVFGPFDRYTDSEGCKYPAKYKVSLNGKTYTFTVTQDNSFFAVKGTDENGQDYDFTGEQIQVKQVGDGNKTFDSGYQNVYLAKKGSLRYNLGDGVFSTVKKTEYTSADDSIADGAAIVLPSAGDVTRTGYTLTGWVGSDGKSYAVGDHLSFDGEGMAFTAVYTPDQYTLKENLDHTGSMTTTDKVTYGETFSTVYTPDKGYDLPKSKDDITVIIDGKKYTDFVYDPDTGGLTIPGKDVTGKIEITLSSVKAGEPTATPSVKPSASATTSVKPSASVAPSVKPSASAAPSVKPSASAAPSVKPSASVAPSVKPSASAAPSVKPSASAAPNVKPSASAVPSVKPSASAVPSVKPSAGVVPSAKPSESTAPSANPGVTPTVPALPAASAPAGTQTAAPVPPVLDPNVPAGPKSDDEMTDPGAFNLSGKVLGYNVPTITVNKILTPGNKYRLLLKNLKGAKIECASTNKKVATINKKGVIRAKKKGKATLVLSLRKGNYICQYYVKLNCRKGAKINYSAKKFEVKFKKPVIVHYNFVPVGKSRTITLTNLPEGTVLKFKSMNKKICTVKAKGKNAGKVIGKKGGHTYVRITATTPAGDRYMWYQLIRIDDGKKRAIPYLTVVH